MYTHTHNLLQYKDHIGAPPAPIAVGTRYMLYTVNLRVGTAKAEVWALPVKAFRGDDGLIHDDVDVATFFPSGCLTVVLCTTTRAYNPLPFAYRVYVDNHKLQRPINLGVEGIFDQLWMGNVVAVKYGRVKGDDRLCYANVQRGEDQLLLALVGE